MEGSSFRVGDKVLYHAGHMDERPPLKKGVIIQIVEKHGVPHFNIRDEESGKETGPTLGNRHLEEKIGHVSREEEELVLNPEE